MATIGGDEAGGVDDRALACIERPAMSFAVLLERARAGDVEAFADLFGRCGRRARRHLRQTLGAGEAEDAEQELFLRAQCALPGFAGYDHGGLSGWLAQVAHNYATDMLRARQREHERVEPGGLDALQDGWEPEDERQAQALRQIESDAEFGRIVGWLPKAQRDALVLRYRLGFDDKRIAGWLGISEPAVWMLAQRAMRSLRQRHAPDRACGAGDDRLAAGRLWMPRLEARFSALPSTLAVRRAT